MCGCGRFVVVMSLFHFSIVVFVRFYFHLPNLFLYCITFISPFALSRPPKPIHILADQSSAAVVFYATVSKKRISQDLGKLPEE